ncbi:MAG: bile acid:sodium symporter family protein [Verrucomicrobiaceae bacterium]
MIIQIALPLILAFIMFSLGLGLKKSDFTDVLKFPLAFAAGLTNQILLLPVVAFTLAHLFSLSPEFAVGLMILSLCPGGVTSNVLAKLSGGNTPLSISLTATTSLLSILTVPFMVAWSVNYFMGESGPSVDVTKLGLIMFLITALPVAIGMITTAKSPGLVKKIAPAISRAALLLFALIVIAALAKNWSTFAGNFTTLAPVSILLILLLLAAGLLTAKLLRLNHRDASTIALESGIQNGTLAIAVGSLIASVEGQILPPTTIPAAVYSITMYLVCVPFVLWRKQCRK